MKKSGLIKSFNWMLLLVALPYLLWEICWAYKVGYACIKWHTRLMVYVYVWIGVYLLLYYTLGAKKRQLFQIGLTVFSAVIIPMMVAEAVVSCLKINETFVEKIGSGYNSFYNARGESRYHTNPPNETHWIVKQEYRYQRPSNSLGFSDPEWPVAKKKNEKRLLALGDSFTEGDGAPYDSSYVSLLRKKFESDSLVYIMNAGVCGSDPFINYVNYADRLAVYQPDIILQSLSSGDISVDLMVRGGFERFLPNGRVQFRKGPWWEPIYALSFLSRFYFNAIGYNQLLMRDADILARKNELDQTTIALFADYAALAKRNNSQLVLVLQPFLNEVNARQYTYDFTAILQGLQHTDNLRIVDLLPFYTEQIKSTDTKPEVYYWPIDGHHNAIGYSMMADGVYNGLK